MLHLDEIQRDLACPSCEYNLRGLSGAIVDCPECGHRCDIALMITQRWTKPWYQAPGLSTIYAPTVWVVVAGLAGTCLLPMNYPYANTMSITAVLIVGWAVQLARAWFVFRSGDGVRLALLSHVIFAAYIAGVVPVIATIIFAVMAAMEPNRWVESWLLPTIMSLVVSVGGVVLIAVGRRGERHIAERCIRHHLSKPPKS